jgi:HK97 family phage major capsid protein
MATIEELLLSIDVELEQAKKMRERCLTEVRTMVAKAKHDGRSNFTEDEDKDTEAAFARVKQLDTDIAGIERKRQIALKTKEHEDLIKADQDKRDPKSAVALPRPAYDQVARVGQEPRTYTRENDRKGAEFVRDVTRQFLFRDPESESRLARHMQEERVERAKYLTRAAGTGAFAGLTVPQYLTDMYAPAVSSMRPFADACNHHDLPASGMTVNISRITTATSAALQASENTGVSETNIDDTLLTENIQTAAGQQTLSRQAIERGTGVEEVVMDDLFRRYAAVLDNTLLSQATTGLVAVATSQAYTDASPTGVKTYAKIIGAQSTVETNLLGFAQPDLAIMHPRRWYALLSSMSANFPLFNSNPAGPDGQQVGVNAAQNYGTPFRGTLPNGMHVVVDSNVSILCNGTATTGGTQDQIYVTSAQECHLWEDPAAPVFLRAEQPAAASLGVLLVLYGYFAYSFRRYTGSVVQIYDTGLAAPTFLGA